MCFDCCGEPRVFLECFVLVDTDVFRVGLHESLIEDPSGKRLVVIVLDRFNIKRRNTGLLGHLADGNTSLFASLPQFFTEC